MESLGSQEPKTVPNSNIPFFEGFKAKWLNLALTKKHLGEQNEHSHYLRYSISRACVKRGVRERVSFEVIVGLRHGFVMSP